MAGWTRVALAADFGPGQCHGAMADGTRIAVFNVDGTFHAIEDRCTHDDGQLTGGSLEGDVVVCPRHGARFCVKTGKALTPPAYEDVPVFPVRIEAGFVEVRDPRWDGLDE